MRTVSEITNEEYVLQVLKKALYWHNFNDKKELSEPKWNLQKEMLKQAIKKQSEKINEKIA